MLSTSVVVLLRVVHIVGGVCWVGAVAFMAFLLMPAMRAAGPAGGPVAQALAQRRMPLYLMAAMVLTVLSGLLLYWHDSAGFSSAWLSSGPGRTFGLGAVLALLAAGVGVTVSMPAARQMGALAAAIRASGAPPTPEQAATMQQVTGRMAMALKVTSGLLLLATAAMAGARYVQ